jgi:hypothetical protein
LSVRKTAVVDWLGLEKGTGTIILTVVDDEDWTDPDEHLEFLQAKLNTYLRFIESGELYQRLEADLGRTVPKTTPIRVSVLAKYRLPTQIYPFLKYAENMFEEAGFSLVHKVLQLDERG